MEKDLTIAEGVIGNNRVVIAGLESDIAELRAVVAPVLEYVEPAAAEGDEVSSRPLLDQVRALPNVIRQVERSSTRECTVRALSSVHLYYPDLRFNHIMQGVPSGIGDQVVQAAEAEVAPLADDIIADLDLEDKQ